MSFARLRLVYGSACGPTDGHHVNEVALAAFLEGKVTQANYVRWLGRKSRSLLARDKKRGNTDALNEAYKMAVHRAVIESGGSDHYTAEAFDWSLLSKYDNASSQQQRPAYKAAFALLPTVDHVGDGLGPADFKVCGWRTNDAGINQTE
jgi:hypothetical protein